MGLDLPDLDDSRYADLRAAAESLLETHTNGWTDRGAADPGITVLELLAWLTETYGYQLDQVTDDHRRKFLSLLGERPRPPEPATAVLSVDAGGSIPAGTVVQARENGERYRFETTRAVTPTGASIERVVVGGDAGRIDVTRENDREDGYFRAFGDAPGAGDALHLGFDADPLRAAETLTLSVDYREASLPERTPGEFDPSVALAWERYTDGEWVPLATRVDGTNAFYEGGTVTLAEADGRETEVGATAEQCDAGTDDPPSADHHWLRCRLLRSGYEYPPPVSAVRADCVPVRHTREVRSEQVRPAERDSRAALDGQRYALEHAPVRSATVSVDGEQWTEVRDFDAAGPDDRVYVLDRRAGTIRFGDGRRGAVPPATTTVTATYTAGGGTAANVSPDARWTVADESVSATVSARGGATGGRDGETVTEALGRAGRAHREPHRAVTEEDFRGLVAETPGTRIERVGVTVEGEGTTVVVVPYAPPDVARPRPSEGLLDAVRDHLGERTLLGERVTVCGPSYVTVDVAIDGRRRADADPGSVSRALSRFVHPVADSGWEFGRPLTPAAVRDRLDSCGSVAAVADVTLTARREGSAGAVETGGRRLLALGDLTWRGRE